MKRLIAACVLWILSGSVYVGFATGASAQGALNDTSLLAALNSGGYQTKALSKGYLVEVHQDKSTMYVQLVLSGGDSKLGLNANLGEVNEAEVSGTQWRALLAANAELDPSVFYYGASNKKLYIHRVFDNRALTPTIIREQLDKFLGDIRSTENLWGSVAH